MSANDPNIKDAERSDAARSRRVHNVNVTGEEVLLTPDELCSALPLSAPVEEQVLSGRETCRAIIDQRDPRWLVVVGPCSIHDIAAAKEYAKRLRALADEVGDTLFLVMRVYFEKPRTSIGWKGFINDPNLDNSFEIGEGLTRARELLLWIAELGLPAATEALDPITPQYLSDLISWSAIGARTTESQTHREMASGLSMPVGIKNGTGGGLAVAINALEAVSSPHSFLGINTAGQVTVMRTKGNPHAHIVLRGGRAPNYDRASIAACEAQLCAAGLSSATMVDCSHGNSGKDPERQPLVAEDLASQVVDGNRSIIGLMIESNLRGGRQSLPANRSALTYGVSITDGCIDWATTERLLRRVRDRLAGASTST